MERVPYQGSEPQVPCGICGALTRVSSRPRCDTCQDLESRIHAHPDRAARILLARLADELANSLVIRA